MGLFSREPAIKGDERQECLSYYEEEKKLRLLYEKVEQLFDERVGKYERALSQARKAKEAVMDGVFANLEKITEVFEYIQQAANEIVKRKKEMGTAPSAALAMSTAWEAAYLDYVDFRNPSNIVAGSDVVEVEARRARARLTTQKFHNSLGKAWKEEREFRKRLKLSGDETRKILDNTSKAITADKWLQKLEKECP
jgi:hypothetical protein